MGIFAGEPSMATVIGIVVFFMYFAFFRKKKQREAS